MKEQVRFASDDVDLTDLPIKKGNEVVGLVFFADYLVISWNLSNFAASQLGK